jgi:hypothetical protein
MNKTLKTYLLALTGAGMLLGVQASYAGIHDPVVNRHQRHQHHRIVQGVKSGELTRGEAKGLAQEQKQIRSEERAYKADGNLNPAERRDLRQDLRQSSRHIYRQKHDAEQR